MILTPKIIEAAMRLAPKGKTDAETARAAADLLAAWTKVANGVSGLSIKRGNLIEEAAKKVKQNDADLAELRRTCPHPATTHHHGYESGDSYDECDVCGGDVK